MSEKAKKHTAEIIDPGLGELDKVRNILFGRQEKAYEERFAEVETRLNKMISELNQNIESRINEIENMFNEFEQNLKLKMQDAEASSSQEISEVRTDIENLNSSLVTDLAQTKGELRSELKSVSSKLSSDKTDRESLAMLFDEMSMRLRNNDSN